MKKLLSSLAFIALFSLAFISCDDNTIDNLTGNMDITVDGENKNFSVATFYTSENKLTITGGVGNGNVTIVIKGKTADTYTLGLGKNKGDLTDDILEGDLSALTSGNILTYTSSGLKTAIYGTVTLSEVTNSKIKGEFTATINDELNLESIKSLLAGNGGSTITGTFTAVNKLD